jgi:hypothetical protein
MLWLKEHEHNLNPLKRQIEVQHQDKELGEALHGENKGEFGHKRVEHSVDRMKKVGGT